MKYEIVCVQELGNEMFPCYEATIREHPSFWERFFGAKEKESKYVSDWGLDWYRLPNFEKIEFNSPLDKTLLEISQAKRTKSIRKLFENIRELKIKTIEEEQRKFN